MVWAEVITIILGILFIVGAIIFNVMINRREMKLDVKPNSSIFINLARTEFTDGYSMGIIKRITPCKNKCYRIEYFPTDKLEGEGTKRPPMQTVIYNRSNLRITPPGSPSGYRTVVWGIGNDPNDIPKGLIDTSLGKWMKEENYLSFLENYFGKRQKETLRAAASMIINSTDLGLTEKQISDLTERIREMEKMMVQVNLKEMPQDKSKTE